MPGECVGHKLHLYRTKMMTAMMYFNRGQPTFAPARAHLVNSMNDSASEFNT